MSRIPPELASSAVTTDFDEKCRRFITENGFRRVCDIGGGRTPLMSAQEALSLGLEYVVVDISEEELDRAPASFTKVLGDICTVDASELQVDFAFSRFVAEHVRDGTAFHQNVFTMLRPGGMACHLLPTLFSPVFVANRLLPTRLSEALGQRLYPGKHKFPARYSKCFGPTPRMFKLFRTIGYEIVEYQPFYGSGYFKRRRVLRRIDNWIGAWGANRRNPYLTSYVHVVLRRPTG